MSQHQYDIQLGQTKVEVKTNQSAGGSIGSSAVRVVIDDSNAVSKSQALAHLKIIEQVLTEGPWPPTP